jgi:hypothetical protein
MGTRPRRAGLMGTGACRDQQDTADAAAVAALLAEDLPAESTESTEPAEDEPLTVYGDSAYGTDALLDTFEQTGVIARCKTQPPRAPGGRFSKSEFGVDLDAGTLSGRSHGRLAGAGERADRPVRRAVCRLSARCEVHRQPVGAHDPLGRARAPTRRRAPDNRTPAGRPTTGRPARRSSARPAI